MTVFAHHGVPDGSLLAPLVRSESDIGAGHQRVAREVPLTSDTCRTKEGLY